MSPKFLNQSQVWELPLTFSFDYVYDRALSRVEFYGVRLNGVVLDIGGYTIVWDAGRKEFSGFLFFEAWTYNGTTKSFQYHDR